MSARMATVFPPSFPSSSPATLSGPFPLGREGRTGQPFLTAVRSPPPGNQFRVHVDGSPDFHQPILHAVDFFPQGVFHDDRLLANFHDRIDKTKKNMLQTRISETCDEVYLRTPWFSAIS